MGQQDRRHVERIESQIQEALDLYFFSRLLFSSS